MKLILFPLFPGKGESFINSRVFKLFNKIAYGVYLTQFPIFFYNVGIQRSSEYYSPFTLVSIMGFFLKFINAARCKIIYQRSVARLELKTIYNATYLLIEGSLIHFFALIFFVRRHLKAELTG